MSKVAKYLNEHMLGEVITNPAVRAKFSTDASVLTITPEMIVYPRVTNDIRKVARFAWQLAEKGHVMPLTARGGGTDDTGAAIGSGAIIALSAHMNRIFEYDVKQRLVRVQPGANAGALNDALNLQGVTIPSLSDAARYSTIGGAIAYNEANAMADRYGSTSVWIHQLEVVLANGDVLQTSRLSKRDLNKKKGSPGFEGDIYRKLDGLIEDNKDLIADKLFDSKDSVGYSAIRDVKHKDGSFDIAPLIAGSQGTLGIISEMILKTDYKNEHPAIALLAFTNSNQARDMVDTLAKLNPSYLEYFDATYFEQALSQGKHYAFYDEAKAKADVATVLIVGFEDFGKRTRTKHLKKIHKLAEQMDAYVISGEDEKAKELAIARDVTSFILTPSDEATSAPPLFDGIYIPFERFEDFSSAVEKLAAKHSVSLPLHARPLDGIVHTRPLLQLRKVGDKQKIFKLLDEYATLVEAHGGYLISETPEGRLKANTAYKQLDDDVKDLFKAIKDIFDPFGILNPGVKQPNELKSLVASLRPTYDTAAFADFVPHS